MTAKKAETLKSGNKKEAMTKKISSKMNLAKVAAGQKKMPAKKVTSPKKEALTKKISSKMNSAKVAARQGKEIKKSGNKKGAMTKKTNSAKAKSGTKNTADITNPVIVIKSVDVSPSSSEKKKKVPKEAEEKEMSVEVSSGEPTSAAKSQNTTVATSSNNLDMQPTSFDLATFVESRLGAINSPSVAQVCIWSEYS